MPELPEVETTVNYLKPKIVGREVRGVWTDWIKVLDNTVSFERLEKEVSGKKISGIERRGKNILLEIGKEVILWIHLKMTGHLLLRPISFFNEKSLKGSNSPFAEKVNQYIHFRIILDRNEELALSDLRKFARVRYIPKPLSQKLIDKLFSNLGVEPLSSAFNISLFKKLVGENKKKQLKIFLLDQSITAGIGNIYASEIAFLARLDPRRKVGGLKDGEIGKLFKSIKKVLTTAVKARGTSISDYRDPEGESGKYQNLRKVYQRKGENCFNCRSKIESFKQGQRTTFWCPKCQN